MDKSLIIDGREILRTPFPGESPFYSACTFQIADASILDVSQAIGSARSADKFGLMERMEVLKRASDEFAYTQNDLERAVQMTGMPIRVVEALFDQIPEIFNAIPNSLITRFKRSHGNEPLFIEALGEGRFKVLQAQEGFCYAITPGNDPRAAALVAGNLVSWGIPFVLRASPRDAAAPLILRALLRAGVDPKFCSLIYFDPNSPETPEKHFKLVDASTVLWTFGPAQAIDPTLRFKSKGTQAIIDMSDLAQSHSDIEAVKKIMLEEGLENLLTRIKLEEILQDHFQGKLILRHEAGNCAALAWGELERHSQENLYQSIGYAIICTAVKSLLVIDSPGYIHQIADFFSELSTGDPLNPDTQVGYIQSRHLDRLEALVSANLGKAEFYGGRRLSPFQAEPLLVHAEADLPDFFGQEIQAYVLAVGNCGDIKEAVSWLNRHQNPPRLAVTLLAAPEEARLNALLGLRCHTLLIDKPSSILMPTLHEGNDYGLMLTQGRLLVI